MLYTFKKLLKKKDFIFRKIESGILDTNSLVLPDFLIIGAQKGGTTWLYKTLQNMKGVYFPTLEGKHDPSEVRYFDERLFNSLKWYSDLYVGHEHEIKGDKTPKYYLLNTEIIKLIKDLVPDIKIIFILRNPIDRAWSHAIMNLKKFHKLDVESDKSAYISFLEQNLHKGFYSQYIQNWLSVFPEEQFKILLYDDLKKEPDDFLKQVTDFLKIPVQNNQTIDLNKKVNVNPKIQMPDDIRKMLYEAYVDEINILQTNYNLKVDHWLR